jgi:hypothetical protein
MSCAIAKAFWCSVWTPNARPELRLEAGAERTLYAVAWMPWLGA